LPSTTAQSLAGTKNYNLQKRQIIKSQFVNQSLLTDQNKISSNLKKQIQANTESLRWQQLIERQ
jgi:hypothetical protein